MAKRFTSTEKWSDPWFRKLPPRLKCLWDWLYTQCDIAGTIDPDFELASFQIGETVTINDIQSFGNRVDTLKSGRFYLTKFIEYQYGTLTANCPAHRPVIAVANRLLIPYKYPIDRVQEKEKEKEKEKEIDKEKDSFGEFWLLYPKRKNKGDAIKAWIKITEPTTTLEKIKSALSWQIKLEQWTRDNGQYIPYPASYLNSQAWLDDKDRSPEQGHPYEKR